MNKLEPQKRVEPEHQGSIWSHPYMIYMMLTLLIFAVMVFIGYLAIHNGWIPNRGNSAS